MTIRKRNDAVKRGRGIDGGLGEDYTEAGAFNDVDFGYPGQRSKESSYAGAYTNNRSGLTRTDGFEHGSASRQIWEDVEANQNPGGEFDSTGPIKAGLNRKQ
jgi:hypothetical protein